jgi:16S rRNA (adenine1518-N6/adenine1519-N6)-dimethyltransferase
VRLRTKQRTAATTVDEKLLWRVVSAGFAQRRKTIHNNLRSAPADLRALVEAAGGAARVLEASEVEPRRRAETLSLEEWARLTGSLEAAGG